MLPPLVAVAEDGGRERLGEQREAVGPLGDLLDVVDVVAGVHGRAEVLGEQPHVVGEEDGAEPCVDLNAEEPEREEGLCGLYTVRHRTL